MINLCFFESEDDMLWLRLDGKLFSLENDLCVGLSYIMPGRSGRFNSIEHNLFDRLAEYIAVIHNHTNGQYTILLSGDFNSRTSVNPDYIDFGTSGEFLSLPDDYTAGRVRPHVLQDSGHTNNNGIALLELCKQTGLRVLNGRCDQDAGIGKYSFVGSRGCSLVDYVLAPEPIFDFITSFKVHDPNSLSDHCLIEYMFENTCTLGKRDAHSTDVNGSPVNCKYKWKPEPLNKWTEFRRLY